MTVISSVALFQDRIHRARRAMLIFRLGGPERAGNLHVRNLDNDSDCHAEAACGPDTAEDREILRQALAAEVEPLFEALAAKLRKLTHAPGKDGLGRPPSYERLILKAWWFNPAECLSPVG